MHKAANHVDYTKLQLPAVIHSKWENFASLDILNITNLFSIMYPNMHIKLIDTEEELSFCRQIRREVFCEEQKVNPKAEFDGFDDDSQHFLCLRNNIPVGTGRLRKISQTKYKIERMAVLLNNRHNGIGSKLIEAIIVEWEKQPEPNKKLVLHSQIQAKNFYEKEGFLVEGTSFIEEGIKHIKMTLDLQLRKELKTDE